MARCFAVIGSPHCGKTTLVDHLARLEDKPEIAAPAPNEVRSVAFDYLGEAWHAIDCPGSIEFLQQSINALLVADAAIVCVPPNPDAAVLAAPYLRAVEAADIPAILFINKIDAAEGRVRDIVAGLQDYANHTLVLRQVPIRDGETTVGAVDLISERAWRYREGEPSALIELPDTMADREREARDDLLETLSEFDDWLLEEIIEDRQPTTAPLFSISARVLRENKAIPVLIGSAEHGNGMTRLMKALRHEAPGVEALTGRLGLQSNGAAPLAGAFHARHRRHVGRTVYMRALTEGLKQGVQLGGNGLGPLVDPASHKALSGGEVEPGAVFAAVKSDHLAACRFYTAENAIDPPGWCAPAPGQMSRVITPTRDKDDVKLSTALARLAADDQALQVAQEEETGAQVVHAQGPQHLRSVREMLAEVFDVDIEEGEVPPHYRETITSNADLHYRHRKQTGGAGQFADIRFTLQPNERGAGFTFDEIVKGGAVPKNYIPAVEYGAREALASGPLGFPVVDVKVTLYDGQHHSVDSSDMAFRIAARSGLAEALPQAQPVLLQPIQEVRFLVPSIFSGALVPIVSSLRGHVLGFDRDPHAKGWDVFRSLLPASALQGLAGSLRSATQGTGRYEASFDHYEELYGREAEDVSRERQQAAGRH